MSLYLLIPYICGANSCRLDGWMATEPSTCAAVGVLRVYSHMHYLTCHSISATIYDVATILRRTFNCSRA